ncbi:glucosamine inositolphosphorylceramide transferase family protein [Teichococcus rhizosphaerae]|uniref:glucosamine inositolphosphorylceramide transferase family protein n=1 Tax=Teichococcus rhizosphaerae TaxID=1335062 RepID=UPI00159BAD2B|nr:hypothetical protein [Pseudoroseomonas rhizosphaerae]
MSPQGHEIQGRGIHLSGAAGVPGFAERLRAALPPEAEILERPGPAGAGKPGAILLRLADAAALPAGAPSTGTLPAGTPSTGRVWRIVDEAGTPLASPRFGRRQCCRAPGLLSVFLVERDAPSASWRCLGEAHLGAWRPHGALARAAAEAAATLVAAAIRQPAPGRPWLAARRQGPDWPGRWRIAHALRRARDKLTSENWAIGIAAIAPAALQRSQVVTGACWVMPPDSRGYHADPFPWPGRPGVVLCEYFDHTTGLGRLRALRLGGMPGQARQEEVPLQARGHLSYPFAWVEDGRVLCMPEMAASRRQEIFELAPDGPPRPVATVAEDVGMADPTLFRHGGLYWVAYTDTALGLHDNLCLMFAEDIKGPWRRHPGNPVKIDVRSSRPAGPLLGAGGRLLRPAQDCAASYGAALVINEILECTPRAYREKVVAVLSPDPEGPFPHGLHTIAPMADGRFLLDGKRVSVSPGILLRRLLRRLPALGASWRGALRPLHKPATGWRG